MEPRAASYHPHSSKHIRDVRKSDFAERRLMRERQTEVTDDLVLRLENSQMKSSESLGATGGSGKRNTSPSEMKQ